MANPQIVGADELTDLDVGRQSRFQPMGVEHALVPVHNVVVVADQNVAWIADQKYFPIGPRCPQRLRRKIGVAERIEVYESDQRRPTRAGSPLSHLGEITPPCLRREGPQTALSGDSVVEFREAEIARNVSTNQIGKPCPAGFRI